MSCLLQAVGEEVCTAFLGKHMGATVSNVTCAALVQQIASGRVDMGDLKLTGLVAAAKSDALSGGLAVLQFLGCLGEERRGRVRATRPVPDLVMRPPIAGWPSELRIGARVKDVVRSGGGWIWERRDADARAGFGSHRRPERDGVEYVVEHRTRGRDCGRVVNVMAYISKSAAWPSSRIRTEHARLVSTYQRALGDETQKNFSDAFWTFCTRPNASLGLFCALKRYHDELLAQIIVRGSDDRLAVILRRERSVYTGDSTAGCGLPSDGQLPGVSKVAAPTRPVVKPSTSAITACPSSVRCPQNYPRVKPFLDRACAGRFGAGDLAALRRLRHAEQLTANDLVYVFNVAGAMKGYRFKRATYLNDFYYGSGAWLPTSCRGPLKERSGAPAATREMMVKVRQLWEATRYGSGADAPMRAPKRATGNISRCPASAQCAENHDLIYPFMRRACAGRFGAADLQALGSMRRRGALSARDLIYVFNLMGAVKGYRFKKATYLNAFYYGSGEWLPSACRTAIGKRRAMTGAARSKMIQVRDLYRATKHL